MHSTLTGTLALRSSEPMDNTSKEPSSREHGLEDAIASFLDKGRKSANYRDALERDSNIATIGAVNKYHMETYATHLNDRVRAKQNRDTERDGITPATAWTYYDYVSAFLGWCVKYDYLSENPAQKGIAMDELPARPSNNSGEQQFWTTEHRQQLLGYVDDRADEALDDRGLDAIEALRDRAPVYVLAYSGVRGGEILSDPRDDRRDGLRWDDVHLEDSYLQILGKSQTEEQAQLPAQTHGPLRRLRRALDPADGSWPVFPTQRSLVGSRTASPPTTNKRGWIVIVSAANRRTPSQRMAAGQSSNGSVKLRKSMLTAAISNRTALGAESANSCAGSEEQPRPNGRFDTLILERPVRCTPISKPVSWPRK